MARLIPFVRKDSYFANRQLLPLVIGNGLTTEWGQNGVAPDLDTFEGEQVEFDTLQPSPILSLIVDMEYNEEGIAGVKIWIEDEYDASADPTVSVTFPETIYGGTYDVLNGILTSTYDADGTKLEHPVTYQLDPATLYTLDGANVIWSDADSVTVRVAYVDKKEYPIVGYGEADYMILQA